MIVKIKTTSGQQIESFQTSALGVEFAAASAIRQAFNCCSQLVPTGGDDNAMKAANGMFFDIVKTEGGLTLLQDS
jgi:hypothetical protein